METKDIILVSFVIVTVLLMLYILNKKFSKTISSPLPAVEPEVLTKPLVSLPPTTPLPAGVKWWHCSTVTPPSLGSIDPLTLTPRGVTKIQKSKVKYAIPRNIGVRLNSHGKLVCYGKSKDDCIGIEYPDQAICHIPGQYVSLADKYENTIFYPLYPNYITWYKDTVKKLGGKVKYGLPFEFNESGITFRSTAPLPIIDNIGYYPELQGNVDKLAEECTATPGCYLFTDTGYLYDKPTFRDPIVHDLLLDNIKEEETTRREQSPMDTGKIYTIESSPVCTIM